MSVPFRSLSGPQSWCWRRCWPTQDAYPATSCIAVLEALAAGCTVVTSARGALLETSAGFARLVPSEGDRDTYRDRFVAEVVQAVTERAAPKQAALGDRLRRQVAHEQQHHTWAGLADERVGWLQRLRAGVRPCRGSGFRS
jgi:hypothetical protein